MMYIKYVVLLCLFFALNLNLKAQIDAEASFSELSFCGINSTIVLQDVSTGAVVDFRSWTIDGPAGFTSFTGANTTETVLLTVSGFYTVRLTVCDDLGVCDTHFYTDFIEVKEKPILSLNISNFCLGSPNVFDAITLPNSLGIDSFYWNFGEGAGPFEGESTESNSFSTTGSKTITIEVVANNGCKDTLTQTINLLDKPTAVITVSDSFICLGNTVNFNGINSISNTPGITYAWDTDFNTGIDNNNVSFISFANTDLVAMLEVTDDNGCVDTAFQNLWVVESPEVDFSATAQCVNQAFELDAIIINDGGSPIDSVYWYIDSAIYEVGNTISYSHPNQDSIPIILFAINEQACQDGMQKYISIDALPVIDIVQEDTVLCYGNTMNIESIGNAEFLWLPDSLTEQNISINPEESTLYTLIGLSENGACPNVEEEILVEVVLEPEYNIDVNTSSVGLGTPVYIDFSYEPSFSSSDSLYWLNSGSQNILEYEIGFENNFIAVEEASFPVQLIYFKDEKRCVFETNVDIKVNEECSKENFYIPNAFSPNDDTKNDNFLVKGFSIEKIISFTVIDRSGKVMYIGEDIEFNNGIADIGWNGKSKNGKICNTGVYVYYYKIKCINGLETQGSGNITLFR